MSQLKVGLEEENVRDCDCACEQSVLRALCRQHALVVKEESKEVGTAAFMGSAIVATTVIDAAAPVHSLRPTRRSV